MNQMLAVKWGTHHSLYRETPKVNTYLFVALAIIPMIAGIFGILAVQKINLGPINSFSSLGLLGSAGLIAISMVILFLIGHRKKEPVVIPYEDFESVEDNWKIFLNSAANEAEKPIKSPWLIYISVDTKEAWPIIQQAISHAEFPIFSKYDSKTVIIEIKAVHQSTKILHGFLQPLANALKKESINPISLDTTTKQAINMDPTLPQYFYYGLNFEDCEESNPANLPEFLEKINIIDTTS